MYGDEDECRLYDTDPSLVAKAISRNRWPKAAGEFKLGLRVDAIDNRKKIGVQEVSLKLSRAATTRIKIGPKIKKAMEMMVKQRSVSTLTIFRRSGMRLTPSINSKKGVSDLC